MFSLNKFTCDIKDVPSDWIFETYLELPESLKGQSVRLNSVFNPLDKTPSMYLYFYGANNTYKVKCFSKGMFLKVTALPEDFPGVGIFSKIKL